MPRLSSSHRGYHPTNHTTTHGPSSKPAAVLSSLSAASSSLWTRMSSALDERSRVDERGREWVKMGDFGEAEIKDKDDFEEELPVQERDRKTAGSREERVERVDTRATESGLVRNSVGSAEHEGREERVIGENDHHHADRGNRSHGRHGGSRTYSHTHYKVYKRRWFGLLQLVLLNIVVSWDVSLIFPLIPFDLPTSWDESYILLLIQ
jgi:hypothetical protein